MFLCGGAVYYFQFYYSKPPILQQSDECIVLYHIPSASGFLRNILTTTANQFGLPSWNPSPNGYKSMNEREISMAREAKLIHGNFTYGFHEELSTLKETNHSCLLFTMLRHPVDRVISDLVQDRQPTPSWKECVGSGKSLLLCFVVRSFFANFTEFKGNGPCRKYRNDMVRRLSGKITTFSYYTALTESSSSIVTPSMLEEAKRNLDKFAVVGISERLQDTTKIMEHVLQWKLTNIGDISTNSGSVRTVDPDLKRLIEETNQADMELYRYAVNLFERRLKAAKIHTPVPQQPSPFSARNLLFRNFWLRKPYFYTIAVFIGMMVGAAIGAGWVHVMINRKKAKDVERKLRRIAELDSAPVSTPTRRRKYKIGELC